MNLKDEIKKVCLTYLTQIVQKGIVPTLQNLESFLELEFCGDWKLLIGKNDLNTWFNNIVNQNFISSSKGIEEILIHKSSNVIEITRDSSKQYSIDLSENELDISFEILCIKENIDWNELNPFVSFKAILNGRTTRISLIHRCLSSEHSHKISIRFHTEKSHILSSFFSSSKDMEVIKGLFKAKSNILICGSTGSGKTSFISSLISSSNNKEHLFIIEDTHEIKSPTISTTRLISKDQPGHSLSDYCKYALRMRPDRIILGEVRSKEITPLILNANNGHKGLISSIHSNTAQSAPQRMATLLCLYSGINGMNKDIALDLICSGIDYIIFLENKKVVQAIKLLNYENGSIHYDDILESTCADDLDIHQIAS